MMAPKGCRLAPWGMDQKMKVPVEDPEAEKDEGVGAW
jgi:hypothetical protein